ncbi:MAG: TIGR02680 family protein, partial [Nocardioidaceae bacterium]
VAERARAVADALRAERRLRSEAKRAQTTVAEVSAEHAAAEEDRDAARTGMSDDDARLRTLEASPEFRNQARLGELAEQATRDSQVAEQAEQRRQRQADDVEGRSVAERGRLDTAQAGLRELDAALRELDRRQREAVPGSSVPVPALLDGLVLDRGDQLDVIGGALDQSLDSVQQARSAATRRTASVGMVRGAIADADTAAAAQREAEREADRAEARWERAREARVTADQAAQAELEALTAGLSAWAATPGAPELALPDELTEESVLGLPELARVAAAPRLTTLREGQAQAASRRTTAQAEIERLTEERSTVEAERDPAPPPPVLPRTERADGCGLWQVVDFGEGVDDAARAGLEAALQAAGLLDAWVRPGGLLLGPDHHDVVLAPSTDSGQPGDALDAMLVPDLPPEVHLSVDDVRRVLASIGTGSDPDASAWVAPDGTWRLGPAHGHAAKEQAQFIGATARAYERDRRLGLIDAALAEQRAAREEAQQEHDALAAAIAELEGWVTAVPSGQALLREWSRQAERRDAEEREDRDNRVAQDAAHAARTAAAEASATLERLAAEQGLPTERGRLDAVEQELRGLDEGLREAARQDKPIRASLALWQEAVADTESARAALAAEQEAAAEATQRASRSQAALEALRASVGDSVQELERKISDVKDSRRGHEEAERAAETRANDLREQYGTAQADARNAEERLSEHLDRRSAILERLVAVSTVPGMLDAAGAATEDSAVVTGLTGHPPGEPVTRHVSAATDRLAGLSQEDASAANTRVWRAHGEAASGPAADHQPIVSEFGDLLAVTGRDDAGEAAVVVLAQRVSASVERDRGLLTEREKQQFEQHVLGELGDAIRKCRRDAEELVTAMNDQLGKVATSQGIRVRLGWKLRDDVPPEARAAVELLAQPVGALIPEERATLRDVLHRLIEASRAERTELSYGEHLAAALDYRTWSEFTIRYTRPETPGQWQRLHRRSALSQGEQKVLCYLPLFAAAAAHFTSLAGAAPHAPRMVLLDDGFPKIDVRTHPLLFGLLVQLDLDFVITSERLWGDHETVPSLAIYEALRDPSQRGIAQYEYRWDGRALQALG